MVKTTPLLGPVVDQLGTDIVSGNMAEGTRFRLEDIEKRFGISRTVAREAMRTLEHLGMVSSGRRVGLKVLPRSSWAVYDPAIISWRLAHDKTRPEQAARLNELRLGVEPVAAQLAARNATPQQRRELLRLAGRLAELETTPSPRVGDELETDLQFHTIILEASSNEMFAALAPTLLAMLKGKSVFGSRKRDPIRGTAQLHMELAQEINAGEAEAAERTSRAILDRTRS
ncbi:FCD domain-containing protein [Corynebacterium macginleyi]|uniref:FadR/GntR family transcriptional regulator n=1 Tax=Corynebacterium macginleyi TaxID=38290 RepID=UPI00190DFE50|nr:FCD domain-containing protein [Corynebacterium macginleyi]MBK4142910.1 FCD domain-containing protein [Corynebacterium macginleyi]MBK4180389.1 FCD domain-containing protein [Corynebacterium macginleyi]